jgi:hypothetical protein
MTKTKVFYKFTDNAISLMILLGVSREDFAEKLLELNRIKTRIPARVVFPTKLAEDEFYVLIETKNQIFERNDYIHMRECLDGTRTMYRTLEFRDFFTMMRLSIESSPDQRPIEYRWDSGDREWELLERNDLVTRN